MSDILYNGVSVSEENLFNNFTAAETTAGSTKYRGLYLLNNHGSISLTASAVYIPTNTPSTTTASAISQTWTLRHDLAASEAEVVENPVRGFKRANRPQFYIPLVKSITVKFRIPIYWVNKLDIDLDLPVYYDVIYTKRITVHSIREQKIRLNTSITSTIKAKMILFKESIQNISLKPDFRLQKMKNLSKLRKLLNNMEKVD